MRPTPRGGARRSLGQAGLDGLEHVEGDGVLVAVAVGLEEDVRVEGENLVDVLVVRREARHHGLTRVVLALLEALHHLGVVGGRRVELEVVHLARLGVRAAALDALDEHVVGHLELHHDLRDDARVLQRLRLRLRAGEAIEQPALGLHVVLLEALLDHLDDEAVGHQRPRLHELIRLLALLGLRLDLLAQQVARADVHDAELLDDLLALRPLAARGRPGDEDLGRDRLREQLLEEGGRALRLGGEQLLQHVFEQVGHVLVLHVRDRLVRQLRGGCRHEIRYQ
mmetsp:Transcript_325/g.1274  ORF Transcript_325/g.1274 Transcript_325/m.1274 type:complete len:282 (-) Transcript_325:20-865(-)